MVNGDSILAQLSQACSDRKKSPSTFDNKIVNCTADNHFSLKLKRKIEVCWRAGGTPAEISTQFGPDWLCEPGDKSNKPQFFFSISMKNGCPCL